MLTLALDTSGKTTLVAVLETPTDGPSRVVGQTTLARQPLTHLHPTIEELLRRLALPMDRIGRLATVLGPGSWTGLNIGVTATKTLAQVLDRPLVGLRSLDVLVAEERWLGGPLVTVFDAKRGKVITAVYPTDSEGCPQLTQVELELHPLDDFVDRLQSLDGLPRVLEYGSALASSLAERLPEASRSSHEALPATGLALALDQALGDASATISGSALFDLAPLYLQEGFQERKAKRSATDSTGPTEGSPC